MLCPSRTYNHPITSAAVDLEARQIAAALTRGGYNSADLDLSGIAAQRLVEEAVVSAGAAGAQITRRVWTLTSAGGVEVAIEVEHECWLPFVRFAIR